MWLKSLLPNSHLTALSFRAPFYLPGWWWYAVLLRKWNSKHIILFLLHNICNQTLGSKSSSCLNDNYFFSFTYPQLMLQTPTVFESSVSRWELVTLPTEIYAVHHYEMDKDFGKGNCYPNWLICFINIEDSP